MASKKIQLYTDRANTIEASPETSANCVILSDGNDLQKVLNNDLTTPTVVHEESSFKTGVGDIDVSSSVVDGEVGRMVIKGKTYQNILPEPSLRNSMTNGKTMQKLNEGYDSVNTVDGVCKSAILKGQTLVNLIKDGYMPSSTTNSQRALASIVSLDGSKEYTLMLNKNLVQVNVRFWYTDGSYGDDYAFSNRAESGYIKNKLRIDRANATGKTLENIQIYSVDANGEITNMVLLEGDYTNVDIPYFTGMQSVKLPVLCTTGKNLFDSSTEIVTGQGINSSNGLPYNYPTHSRTGFLRVKPNTSYTITQSHNKTWVFAYDKNKEYIKVVKTDITSGGNFTTPNDTHYIRLDFNTVDTSEIVNGVQIEEGTVATSYEPYKTNILTVNEEAELRGIGEGSNRVEDELNLLTGELTQRIGEINTASMNKSYFSGYALEPSGLYRMTINIENLNVNGLIKCDKLPVVPFMDSWNLPYECITIYAGGILLYLKDVPDIETYVNKAIGLDLIIQYEKAQNSVKTVDLSSSGNWEKVVLDGSENWTLNHQLSNANGYYAFHHKPTGGLVGTDRFMEIDCDNFTPTIDNSLINKMDSEWCTWHGWSFGINICIKGDRLLTKDANGFKQWLRDNPTSVWYPINSVKDSTQVKQPIFFKDGHIQLSSGADNSLIPTLDYQAKTSNSYVMDLMKTNTRYTMKAKSASGTFTIDGTSYGAGTNGTFTSPSSMTNKLLVMSNKTNEEVMIIEGDVVSKTIPYFKGIKSAFEDEDKIEVLSTSKNLLSPELYVKDNVANGVAVTVKDSVFTLNGTVTNYHDLAFTPNNDKINLKLEKGKRYRVSLNHIKGSTNYSRGIAVKLTLDDGTIKWLGSDISASHLTMNGKISWIRMTPYEGDAFNDYTFTLQVEESPVPTPHEPHRLNATKIPLLSPLRSLPNGVCDELIVDRMKKKATLIQRIKSTVFNGSEGWNLNGYSHDKLVEFVCHSGVQMAHTVFSDRFITGGENVERVAFSGGSIYIRILKTKVSNVDSFKKWLSQNPLTVQYGLQTPLITEIDLENFPLVYKDGHIFLNSEIAPVVEIDYNINQSQQIQSNNETLQRHELDILDLDNLIVSFVNAEYNLRLLKFDMELSMMALAE